MRRPRRLATAVLVIAATLVSTTAAFAEPNEATTPALTDKQRLVAVGALHTCAVMDTGIVRCWGDNANGQLGNGGTAVSTQPTPVLDITNAVGVTAGNAHTCALLADGTVQCWGLNSNGQLGVDPVQVNFRSKPDAVPGLSNVRAIAAGGFHTCALLATGSVRCWGLDGVGQLGDGAGTPSGNAITPVDVNGIANAVGVAAGEFHTCALLDTGGAKCWGHNGFGQLGNGTTNDADAPVAVSGLPDGDKKAIAITTGYGHSCVVVDDDDPDNEANTVRCWGNNTQGQLGDGTTTARNTPVVVQFDKNPNPFDSVYSFIDFTGADAVSAGQYHTCARTAAGWAWCWGNAGRGQIGNNTKGDTNTTLPDEGEGSELRFMWRSAKPVSIGPVDAVTAGGFHSCALTGTAMQCWGYNFYGQLGSYLDFSAEPVTVTALQGAASVATGTDGACARVLVPGTPDTHQPVCWGTNQHGELGAGTTVPSSTVPVEVKQLSDVDALAAGDGVHCALPTGSNTVKCWGRNGVGQLGNGTTIGSGVPVSVSGLASNQVSVGGLASSGHSCARAFDGTARCWGDNHHGQLGNGSSSNGPFTTPVTVMYDTDPDPAPDRVVPGPLPGVVAVAAGGSHSCALKSDTTVWCWGANGNGQLGDNTTDQRRLAVQVKLEDKPPDEEPDVYLTNVAAVVAGDAHTCALMAGPEAGKVRCWGANGSGQLGDGTILERHLPTLMPSIPSGIGDSRIPLAAALTAGAWHTCAVMDNASARCWGDNSTGQLGRSGGNSSTPVTPVGIDNDTADTVRNALVGLNQPDDLVTSLSAGRRNTCASLIDNTVSCWGVNNAGQLGDGIGPTRLTPIEVKHLSEGVGGNASPTAVDDLATTGEDTAVAVSVLLNDTDPDGDPLVVTRAEDPAHGSVTWTGSVVTYKPDLNTCGTDTVRYRVFDNANGMSDALIKVNVLCANDAPVAVDDAAAAYEDTPLVVLVLDNDTDPDAGDSLSVASVTQPAHGSVTFDAGSVTYSPDADYTGPDSFTYVVQDAAGVVDTGSVSVTVSPVNDPPVTVDDNAGTNEDTAVTVAVLANDTDVDGDALSVASVTQPAHGTAVIVPGGVKYTPAVNYNGPDSFTYTAGDGKGGSAVGNVSLTVSAVNNAPNAVDDTASATGDTSTTIPVLDNDTDVDGNPLTIASVTQPQHGTAEIVPTGVRYTPTAGYTGPDSFTYTAEDGDGASDGATVSITVYPPNYAPFGRDDIASTPEDTAVDVAVLANDFDPNGDAISVTSVTQPAHGSVAIASGGTGVTYTPAADFWGTDSFTYTVSDGNGGSDVAAVSVTVSAVNDEPSAVDDGASTPEDTAATITVLANDTDADGDVLSLTSVTQPSHGTTSISSGAVRYTPVGDFSGPDSFTYTVSDGKGGTDTATVAVNVAPVNDPPTLEPIADQSTRWGSPITAYAVGHDVDSSPLTYSLVSAPPGAAVDNDGMITWTPGSGDVGVHTLTARVSDGAASADRSFKVTVAKRLTALAYNGAADGQYSDRAAVSATLTSDGAPVGNVPIAFSLAGQSVTATTDSSGAAGGSVVVNAAPGSATAAASFAGNSAYEPSSTSASFTVRPEDASVAITGPFLVVTSGTSAPATLTAAVQEAGDGSLGSGLSGAQVRFTNAAGVTLCTAGVAAGGPGTGTASCTTAALPTASSAVIARLVSPLYAARVDVAALAVASVPTGAAAGGGTVMDEAGSPSAFAFRATPAKRGAPTGDAVQVFRQRANVGGGERDYAFVVTTASLTSLTRTCTGKSVKVCSATVQGDGAAMQAVDLESGDVVAVGGLSAIRIDARDSAEPSGGSVPPDGFAVAVTGPRPFTIGSATDLRLLTAGNIRIPA